MDTSYNAGSLGILYAEDFGLEHQAKVAPVAAKVEPQGPPPLTQADIDAASLRAVQAAEAAWCRSAEERRAEALTALAQGLTAVNAEAAEMAEAVADAIARTALAMLAGALPNLCRTHGEQEVRALMRHVAPLLGARTRVVARVHAGVVDALRDDLDTMDDALAGQIELRPANLPPGDVRLSWEDGSLVRDTAAICAAMQEALAQLGLTGPAPIRQPDPEPSPGPGPGPGTTSDHRSPALAQ